MKSQLVGLMMLCLLYTAGGQDCDLNDKSCKAAQEFSQNAKAACAAKFTGICTRSSEQLKFRFLAKFVQSEEYEEACRGKVPDTGRVLEDCEPEPIGRKKRALRREIRKKRQIQFIPDIYWRQDKSKFACCVTTRRTLPHRKSCGNKCFIVYCPLEGGYQWIDEVKCDVTKKDFKKLGVNKESRQGCQRNCTLVFTTRTYVVTNVPPKGFLGHCLDWWLPIWFRTQKVPSHCYCPTAIEG